MNGRERLVQALQRHVPVHCLGTCLHNHAWPANIPAKKTVAVLQTYLFSLAAENGNSQDYVTEKVYQALSAGTIPIYLGAPNVADFVPEDSVIEVPSNFDDAAVERVVEIVK